MNTNDSHIIQVIVRASSVLDCFCREHPDLSINEIASMTQLNKGTVYRILVTLQHIDWVEQDKTTKRYHLGIGLFRLGNLVRNNLYIVNAARPILEEIHRTCDETVLIYSRYGEKMITLDCIAGSQFVRAAGDAGTIMPFTPAVLSVPLLAYMSEEEIFQVLPTITSERYDQLKQDIATVRVQGFIAAPGDQHDDALGIGAPIFDNSGTCVAELCLYGPLMRVDLKRQQCISAILNGANQISLRLGAHIN